MTVTTGRWSRGTVARWAGGLYVAYILANVLASVVGHIGLSDASTLRATITGDETMFRLGLVAALGSALLFVLTAWALYTLLRPVDEPLALLLLVLNAVGVAVQSASYLPLLAVLARGTAPRSRKLSPPHNSTAWPCCRSRRSGSGSSLPSCSSARGCSRSAGWCCAQGLSPASLVGSSFSTASPCSSGSSRCCSPLGTPQSATRHGLLASSPSSPSHCGSSSKV